MTDSLILDGMDPILLPRPRRMTLFGSFIRRPSATDLAWRAPMGFDVNFHLGGVARGRRRGVGETVWLDCRLDPDRPRDAGTTGGQSYLLRMTPPPPRDVLDGPSNEPACVITSGTTQGLALGLATLRQLLTQYAGKLPAVVISDEPSFATRGVMLDVSRCRVPTMEELRRVIDWLASLKCNHLQLYTEHTFAYAGHEEAWRGHSPITPEELRQLDEYAAGRGVRLVANQNCFGHLAAWLRLPKYQHLAETHGDWVFDVWPRTGPFSLCPVDPGSIEFVKDLLGQLLPCLSTPLVNIGCDETFDVGFGRSNAAVEERGRAAVYLEFVAKVAAEARKLGKRPMFWADIALSHPECIPQIPPELISLAWGYEPSSPFEKWATTLSEAKREFWVCPGTSSWRSITGRTSERAGNISAAAAAGVAHGATGLLVCDWGDTGHHQQWPIAAHGIAQGLAAAWNQAAEWEPVAASLHAHGDRGLLLGAWLDELGNADLRLRRTCLALSRAVPEGVTPRLLNQTALFIDLFKRLDEQTDVGLSSNWELAAGKIAELGTRIPAGLSQRTQDELRHTLAYALFAADRGLGRRTGRAGDPAWRSAMRGRLAEITESHRRLWLAVAREGGLAQSLGYFEQVGRTFDS